MHLSFTDCLGPCATGNFALLLLYGQTIALHDLNDPDLIPQLFDWIEAALEAGSVLPPPQSLCGHIFERFATSEDRPCGGASRQAGPIDGSPQPTPETERSIRS